MSEQAAETLENEQAETTEGDSKKPASSRRKAKETEPEVHFDVGDVVVVRANFHSRYFRGLTGTIQGEAEKGGVTQLLWPVKIDVPPYQLYIGGKYLQLKEEAQREAAQADKDRKSTASQSNGSRGGSFLSRIIPWKK